MLSRKSLKRRLPARLLKHRQKTNKLSVIRKRDANDKRLPEAGLKERIKTNRKARNKSRKVLRKAIVATQKAAAIAERDANQVADQQIADRQEQAA